MILWKLSQLVLVISFDFEVQAFVQTGRARLPGPVGGMWLVKSSSELGKYVLSSTRFLAEIQINQLATLIRPYLKDFTQFSPYFIS